MDGWEQSSVIVLKMDQDVVTECAHTILPPEKGLIDATGGIMLVPGVGGEDEPVAVVCGGEFGLQESVTSTTDIYNMKCMILCKNQPPATAINNTLAQVYKLSSGGFLNEKRIGAESLVIDNGRTLWLTSNEDFITEFVAISNNTGLNEFQTNGAGPTIELFYHCLLKIGSEVGIVIGGTYGSGVGMNKITFNPLLYHHHATNFKNFMIHKEYI